MTPARRTAYEVRRKTLTIVIGTLTFVGTPFAIGVAFLTEPSRSLVVTLSTSSIVRGLFMIVTVVSTAVIGFGIAIRYSWIQTYDRGNAATAIIAGSVCGIVLPFLAAIGVGSNSFNVVGSLFGGAALVLVTGWGMAWVYVNEINPERPPGCPTVTAVVLAVGGIAVSATVDGTVGLETARATAVSLIVLAAALFLYDTGQYAQTLADEVGRDGATRRPQLVRLGWSAVVVVVGIIVTVFGLGVATVLAPTLSAPATVSIIAAITALLAGAWLLFRSPSSS